MKEGYSTRNVSSELIFDLSWKIMQISVFDTSGDILRRTIKVVP